MKKDYIIAVLVGALLAALGIVITEGLKDKKEHECERLQAAKIYMDGHVDGAIAGMRAVRKRDLDVYFIMAKDDSVKFVNRHTK